VRSLALGKDEDPHVLTGPPLACFHEVQRNGCAAVRTALGAEAADAPETKSAMIVGLNALSLTPLAAAADAAAGDGGSGGGGGGVPTAERLPLGRNALLLAGPLGEGMFGNKYSKVDFGAPLGVPDARELCYTALPALSRILTLPIAQRASYVIVDCVSLGLDWEEFRLKTDLWGHRFALFSKVIFLLTFGITKVQVSTASAHRLLLHVLRCICTRLHVHIDVVVADGNDFATITVAAVFMGRGCLFSLAYHPTAQRSGERKIKAFVAQMVHDIYAGIGDRVIRAGGGVMGQ
jgi:hypothetical protein